MLKKALFYLTMWRRVSFPKSWADLAVSRRIPEICRQFAENWLEVTPGKGISGF